MNRRFVAGILALAAAVSVCFSSCGADDIDETPENESLYYFKARTELPEGLEQPFAAEGEEAVCTPALWKVTDTDGEGFIYLLGSDHYLTPADYPVCHEVEEAYEQCDKVAVEIYSVDSSRSISKDSAKLGDFELANGDSLDRHLTEKQYSYIRERLEELGQEPTFCDCWTAWYAYQTVYTAVAKTPISKDKPNSFYGFDAVIQILGNRDGKEVLSIETAQMKQDIYNNLDDEMAGLLIERNLSGDGIPDNSGLTEAWKQGDFERCYEMTVENSYTDEAQHAAWERYLKLLVYDRNDYMTSVAKDYLANDMNVLFVVGAGHFGGEKGIIRQLENGGYTVERIC